MAKNVLRDNKALVKRVFKGYSDSADNLDSYVFVRFLDNSCLLNFRYKDYKYRYVIYGLSLETDSEDIKVVEHKGKGIICLDTNNIFKLSRLRDDGILIYPDDISISAVLYDMASRVYKDLLNRFSEFGLLEDLMSFYTAKFGEFCDDLETFSKLFVKHNKEAFISMLGDIKASIADSYYHIPKSVYAKDGLVGLCCLNFDKNVIVYPSSGDVDIEKMEIFTKAIRNFMRFNSITDFMKSSSNINYSQLNLYVSFRGKGNKYTADSGSSMIEMVC